MREFFRGWRRKVGCIALVMACVLAGLWVRSYFHDDFIGIGTSNRMDILSSLEGKVQWKRASDSPPVDCWVWWGSNDNPGLLVSIPLDDAPYEPTWAIPYWSITIPLILLSAYLILWKPRPK